MIARRAGAAGATVAAHKTFEERGELAEELKWKRIHGAGMLRGIGRPTCHCGGQDTVREETKVPARSCGGVADPECTQLLLHRKAEDTHSCSSGVNCYSSAGLARGCW